MKTPTEIISKTEKISERSSEDEDPKARSDKRKRSWSVVVKFLTLTGCSIAAVVQFNECYQKLSKPPVTTHTRFHVNDTLWYPALTICREPAFRAEVLLKYGLGTSPRFTSEWKNFPWGEVTMKQLFTEATFPPEEVFLVYGLNEQPTSKRYNGLLMPKGRKRHKYDFDPDIEISSSYFFESGACHTLTPKSTTRNAGLDAGYSLVVTHSGVSPQTAGESSKQLGWRLFVHEASETWTEVKMQSLGRQEAVFVEIGEEIHVRISVEEFLQTNVGKSRSCANEVKGGEVRCMERCRWERIAVNNCGAPWLPGLDLPECDNFNDTSDLIINYLNYGECGSGCCGCRASCRFVRYDALPISKKYFASPMSQIYVFFNSRLVTLMEEKPAYDASSFLAEMGGSLGFLLGLSVLGVINFFERSIDCIASWLPPTKTWDGVVKTDRP